MITAIADKASHRMSKPGDRHPSSLAWSWMTSPIDLSIGQPTRRGYRDNYCRKCVAIGDRSGIDNPINAISRRGFGFERSCSRCIARELIPVRVVRSEERREACGRADLRDCQSACKAGESSYASSSTLGSTGTINQDTDTRRRETSTTFVTDALASRSLERFFLKVSSARAENVPNLSSRLASVRCIPVRAAIALVTTNETIDSKRLEAVTKRTR